MNKRQHNFTSKAIKKEFEEMQQHIKEDPNYGDIPHPRKISWWGWILMMIKRTRK